MMTQIVVLLLFVMTFVSIIMEEKIGLEKYKSSMFFGLSAWLVLLIEKSFSSEINLEKLDHIGQAIVKIAVEEKKNPNFALIEHAFNEYVLEISILWLFLICAMTFVAYLDKRGWIGDTIMKLLPAKLGEKKFLAIMGGFTFLFSGVADNLTATLVALTIITAVMPQATADTKIRYGVMIVWAANAGGLPLITGDVTTLMIFVAGKIHMGELLRLYVPAALTTLGLYVYLARGMNGILEIPKEKKKLNPLDTKIAVLFALTIAAILGGHIYFHLPPVLVFLTGLSLMFLLFAQENRRTKQESKVLEYVQHVEFDALFFFMGILLVVGALKEVGLLAQVAVLYEVIPTWAASFGIGLVSAVVDNIPITAAMLKADLVLDEKGWMLLTYSVGMGGSILVIGSAAGVVAMTKVKEMTFAAYARYAPVLFLLYTTGFGITYLVA